jgi:hypothetical protein
MVSNAYFATVDGGFGAEGADEKSIAYFRTCNYLIEISQSEFKRLISARVTERESMMAAILAERKPVANAGAEGGES